MEGKAHHVGCVRREAALTFPDRRNTATISVLPVRLQHGGKSAVERHDIGDKPEVYSDNLIQV